MFRIFHVRMYDGNKAYHPSDRRIINREVAIKIRFDLIRPHFIFISKKSHPADQRLG